MKRKKTLKLLISILIAVCIGLIGCIAIIFVGKNMLDTKNLEIQSLTQEIERNKQTVYVAMTPIRAGEVLEDGVNIFKQQIYTGLDASYYMQEDMLGGIAVLDIEELQPIESNMVTALEITQDTREYEIAVANLMTDQAPSDYVDVRIMFPTGEDYLVLTKKPIHNLILANSIFYTYLNEDEILRIASATIDAFTISGTKIYTARYVSPSLQDDAIPNYLVKPETIDLINTDPNILEIATETLNQNARINLEGRLRGLSEDQLKAIADGHEIADSAKQSVLLDVQYTGTSGQAPEGGDEEMLDESAYGVNNETSSTTEVNSSGNPAGSTGQQQAPASQQSGQSPGNQETGGTEDFVEDQGGR